MFKRLLVILMIWGLTSWAFAWEGSVSTHKTSRSNSSYEQPYQKDVNSYAEVDIKRTNPKRARLSTTNNSFFHVPVDSTRNMVISTILTPDNIQNYPFDTEFMELDSMDYQDKKLLSQSDQQLSLLNDNKKQLDKNNELCFSIFLPPMSLTFFGKNYQNTGLGGVLPYQSFLNVNIPCWHNGLRN